MKILKQLNPIRLAFLFVAILGFFYGLTPLRLGVYDIGCLFMHSMCLAIAFFAMFYKKIKGKIMDILLACFVVFVLYCGFCLTQIIAGQSSSVSENSTIVILGAKVNQYGPTLSYRDRLDAGYEYLIENENSICIVTGGQGENEPMPEGQVGKDYLVKKGIDKSRIIAEVKSKDTLQNLEFSLEIINENNLNKNIAIVTQGFHQYRATMQAKSLDFESVGSISAYTNPILAPAFYSREILAVTKQYIYTLLRLR